MATAATEMTAHQPIRRCTAARAATTIVAVPASAENERSPTSPALPTRWVHAHAST